MIIKQNTVKLASGGATAWASYIPIGTPAATADATTSASTGTNSLTAGNLQAAKEQLSGLGLLDNNMIKFLYEKGLPSDVETFISKLDSLSNGVRASLFGPESTSSLYKLILSMLPRLRAELTNFTNAVKAAEENGALNEAAVSSNGQVFVMKEGKITPVNINDISPEDARYLITNGQLANYRQNSSDDAFDSGTINIIANGTGVKKIHEYVNSVISKLGADTQTHNGYIGVQGNQIIKGLEAIKNMKLTNEDLLNMSVDGLYKALTESSSLAKQAADALTWIWGTLPTNMRMVLETKAKISLGSENAAEGALKLLTSLVLSLLSGSIKTTFDLEASLLPNGTKASTSKDGSSGSKDGEDLGAVEALLSGFGDNQEYRINVGTTTDMKLLGNSSILTDKEKNPISRGTLQDAKDGQFNSVLDWNNATMGGQELNSQLLHRVALNGNKIVAADLPVDLDELQRTGLIRPDMDMLRRKEAADREIITKKATTPQLKNLIYQAHQLPLAYDLNGNLIESNYRRFGIIAAYADESAFMEDPSLEDTVAEVTDKNVRSGIATTLKSADKDYEMSNSFWGSTSIYQGSVYIPLISSAINASLGSKNYFKLPKMSAEEAQIESENALIEALYLKTGSLSTLK